MYKYPTKQAQIIIYLPFMQFSCMKALFSNRKRHAS